MAPDLIDMGDKGLSFEFKIPDGEWEKILGVKSFEYIDDTMDTSDRPVVDFNDDSVDALYYCVGTMDSGKTLLSEYKPVYIKGIKGDEEKMNKVLELWYERKNKKIEDKYAQLENDYMLEHYSVLYSFNELLEKFNDDLESLYKMDKATEQFILKENAPNNVFKYCIDDEKLIDEAKALYETKKESEKDKIRETYKEAKAQLSLSDDLKYQQEVLERYSIINKKTKKIVG